MAGPYKSLDDLDAAIDFFGELGLALEGRATIEGEWAGRVTGLGDQHVEIAMMRHAAELQFGPWYDPKGERIRA